MQTINDQSTLRQLLQPARLQEQTIALVPTMGNLHRGHIKLVEHARNEADLVVCSIFVNPMQFGANEDLDAYPRTLAGDQTLLEQAGCDYLFTPNSDSIYPHGMNHHTAVNVPDISINFCGTSRPGHFQGVATIVTKLFNMVQPSSAYFGLKDYQQFLVIQRLTADLCLPIKVIGVETQREESGLALSSRNQYLTAQERQHAPLLQACLQEVAAALQTGDKDYSSLEKHAESQLTEAGFKPDYFSICNAQTLGYANSEDTEFAILAAAYLGKCRLIDNVRVTAPRA